MADKGGWFAYNRGVSYCTISEVDAEDYHIEWGGVPIVIDKRYRFPTALAAQLFNISQRTMWGAETHKTDVAFFEELSRRFEEEAELTDKAWFLEWNICETEYTVKLREWCSKYEGLCEVQSDLTVPGLPGHVFWNLVRNDTRFKTEPGAVFCAEAKLLKDRIEQEERLYAWLKDFGGRVDEHDEEVDEFEV